MVVWETVAGTGHRPGHLPAGAEQWARREARNALIRLIDGYGMKVAVSGLALGWDTWWAHEALCAGVQLWVHVPFPQQPLGREWSHADRDRYHWLIDRATRKTIYGSRYDVKKYHERNMGMVRAADAMAALHDPSRLTGGTYETLRKVPKTMPVIRFDPVARSVTWPPPVLPVDVQDPLF